MYISLNRLPQVSLRRGRATVPTVDERAPTSEARREAAPQLQRFPRLAQETEQRAETSPEGLGQFNSSFQLSIR